jgi:hypothetical protein
MASPDDRPDDDLAPLTPEERPSRGRRDDGDRPHYEEPHRGVLILVLGIIGLVACPLLGVAAWIMGSGDLKKMEDGVMDPEGKSNTQIGKILGIVATIILCIQLVFIVLWVAGMAFFFGAVATNKPVAPAPQFAPVESRVDDAVPIKQRPKE